MILFYLILLLVFFESDTKQRSGDPPEESPGIVSQESNNFATAFYWEAYGAISNK